MSTSVEVRAILVAATARIASPAAKRVLRDDMFGGFESLARGCWVKAADYVASGKLTRDQALAECAVVVSSAALDAALAHAQKGASTPSLVSGRVSVVQRKILDRLRSSEHGCVLLTDAELVPAKRLVARSPRLHLRGRFLKSL